MDLLQAMIWMVGAVIVIVVIRMLWVAMFDPVETDAGRPEQSEADDEGTWIEIDIEPLFPSSEGSVIDLTSEQEPESRA